MPPRTRFPPTPAPSTDIVGKPDTGIPNNTFNLPPSAYGSPTSSDDASSYRPTPTNALPSPRSPSTDGNDYRKMSSTVNNIILPPPPTRTRKIIQMKPGLDKAELEIEEAAGSSKSAPLAAANGKKKQASGTSAGRKIARKTAHSLIERRRRSKMNEEFGVLKDMIPACDGQEMHKLAILQASIDYLRYLEQCVTDLKASRNGPAAVPPPSLSTSRSQSMQVETPNGVTRSEAEAGDHDEDMEYTYDERQHRSSLQFDERQHHTASIAAAAATAVSAHTVRPTTSSSVASRQSTMPSPAFSASHGYGYARRPSAFELPSPRTDPYYSHHTQSPFTRYPPSAFSAASPLTFSNHASNYASPTMPPYPNASAGSNHPSPMILPQSSTVLDHEASAALLMLNASDRRLKEGQSSGKAVENKPAYVAPPSRSNSGVRGMSVQDLLRH